MQSTPFGSATCSCGRKKKTVVENCGTSSLCNCRKNNQACNRKCRCLNCKNKLNVKEALGLISNKGCHCGSTMVKKNPMYMSCKDSNNRKCKCPCVAYGIGCTDECRCFNCCNILGKHSRARSSTSSSSRKRKRTTVSPYKRKNSANFIKSMGSTVKPADLGKRSKQYAF